MRPGGAGDPGFINVQEARRIKARTPKLSPGPSESQIGECYNPTRHSITSMKRVTEEQNPSSRDLDLLSTEQVLTLINREDQLVPRWVQHAIPALARAVDDAAERIRQGGRVFYVGSGTSGRLGVLDAADLPTLFGISPDAFQGVLPGGYGSCHAETDVSEDDPDLGARDLEARNCQAGDVVVGISASGETPYTRGALAWASRAGALTIAICCNPDCSLSRIADHPIAAVVGPEIIAGSTRLKAATAQKLVLNMFSTAVMVKLGRVHDNLMINVKMKSAKLKSRGLRILMEASGMTEMQCRSAMRRSRGDLRVALLILLGGLTEEAAREKLEAHDGNLRKTLESL